MRLAALTALVMTAFAANSILNRMAVGPGLIGATDFALIRAVAGAAMLGLVVLRGIVPAASSRRRIPGALGLALYLVGFSTGLYRHRRRHRRADPLRRRATDHVRGRGSGGRGDGARGAGSGRAGHGGAGVAGLARGRGGAAASATLAMLAAALGWGIYSLVGRRATDPLAETAANFVLAAPLCAVVLWPGRAGGGDMTEPKA
jgi:drug/metabolite transporter (DMT)-like permease